MVLAGAVSAPAAGASRVPAREPTCDITGSAIVQRPPVPALPAGARDKKNLVTITANLTNCRPSDPQIVQGSVDHGVMVLKIKAPSYVTHRFLTAATISYAVKVTTYYSNGTKWATEKQKWTSAASPFRALPGQNDPAAPVALRLSGTGILGSYQRPYVLTLVTSLVAPNVDQPNAPAVASFNIGSFMGEGSSVVVPPQI